MFREMQMKTLIVKATIPKTAVSSAGEEVEQEELSQTADKNADYKWNQPWNRGPLDGRKNVQRMSNSIKTNKVHNDLLYFIKTTY